MEPLKEIAGISIELLKETGALDRVKDWLMRKEQYTIIVLGASGTGKTALGKRLRGLASSVPRQLRSTMPDVVRGKLGGRLRMKFIDTPGQLAEPFKTHRFRALQKAMAERKLGVVNVTSYGYHEGLAAPADATTARHNPKEQYLEDRRREEIELLREWVNLLCGGGGAAKWLITVCSKADLWSGPGETDTIINHYMTGPYARHLEGAADVEHSVLQFSSHNQMFYDAVPMSGYYTDQMRAQDHAALVARMLDNCARESL